MPPDEIVLPEEQTTTETTTTEPTTIEPTTNEVIITTEQLNKFIEVHNDGKQFQFDVVTLILGIIVGYIAIKGLLANWKS